MAGRFKAGDRAYIVENNRNIAEVVIVKVAAGFATVRFAKGAGGTRVRESRLFATQLEAEKSLPGCKHPKQSGGNRNGDTINEY